MTKKLSPLEKKSRKPASRACVFCHAKHLQCSNERPCKNCVKRNIADQCQDIVRRRAKYLNNGERQHGRKRRHRTADHEGDSTGDTASKSLMSNSTSSSSSNLSSLAADSAIQSGKDDGSNRTRENKADSKDTRPLDNIFTDENATGPKWPEDQLGIDGSSVPSNAWFRPFEGPRIIPPNVDDSFALDQAPTVRPDALDPLSAPSLQQQLPINFQGDGQGKMQSQGDTAVSPALPTSFDTSSAADIFEPSKGTLIPNTMSDTTNDVLNKLLHDTPVQSDDLALAGRMSRSQSIASDNMSNMFSSNYLNQEYLMLGDIILNSKPSSPSSSTDAQGYSQEATISPANTILRDTSFSMDTPKGPESSEVDPAQAAYVAHKLKDTRPFISLGVSNNFSERGTTSMDSPAAIHSGVHGKKAGNENIGDISGTSGSAMGASSAVGAVSGNTEYSSTDQNGAAKATAANVASAADPANSSSSAYISPLASHNIYQSVRDIYSHRTMNFDYPQSYHSLTHFLKERFSGRDLSDEKRKEKRQNLLIILKLIASYRPTFISAHKSLLKPYDLLFLEMSFQRSLLDCEKLVQLNSSPTIMWRRTGEIVSMSNDLLSILGLSVSEILSKRTFIIELMYDDESIINYFKLFQSVAVGSLHSRIVTTCKLKKKSTGDASTRNGILAESMPRDHIEFCSVWTVKRDLFDIPMLIVGQFLPVLPGREGVRKY
ncbi:Piso0_005096 [Millerozyma farinosa CBS 7064]|uniref:Glucose starvation modulator protein 1 n=1 Tax=Pichia sorbitophila (strain ATCC MYA-4447 / BCRC 22081 / CBS 7064 / NBRC 10061 / NRRL Y-12695) TaxID=559304 RepID=G8Y480_PICSO|nr:Piso0_005096 [Millerozyma farinosa CBS 7064]